MPELFPSGYEKESALLEGLPGSAPPTGYAPSVDFDGDLRRDGRFRLTEANGVEAWRQWCRKCLLTERYGSPCYSSDFGIETAEALAAGSREKAESILTKQISEALLADPRQRTLYVRGVGFTWLEGGGVEIEVSVVGKGHATADFTFTRGA